jgi:hypothetical protein
MLVLSGCSPEGAENNPNLPPPPPKEGAGTGSGIPAAPSAPSKKVTYKCDKCQKISETAGQCCGAEMKKIEI